MKGRRERGRNDKRRKQKLKHKRVGEEMIKEGRKGYK